MELSSEIFGQVIVVHAPREVTEDHAEQIQHHLSTLDQAQVILDLDEAESLDSSGLEMLLDAQDSLRGRSGDLKIVTSSHVNRKILEITRLDDQLEVFDCVIDAVKSYG